MPSSQPTKSRQVAPWWAAIAFGVLAVVSARYSPVRSAHNGFERDADDHDERSPDAAAPGPARPGRGADTPSALPVRSWQAILGRVYTEIGNDRVLAVAAGVTFYSLLAVFPAIVALVSLYGLFADPNSISEQLNGMKGILPGGALDIVAEQVKRIASKPAGSLGLGFVSGLAVALWSANAGMKAMFDALNIVYDEKEKRGFIALNAVSLAFTLGAIVLLLLALSAVVVMPIVLKFVSFGGFIKTIVGLARWPLLLVLIALGLALVYRYGPSRKLPRWRWVTWGSGFAAIGWVAGSILFSWYVSAFGSYNETYGSLGAAIGFMTWIWISTTIVLVGAEINAEMEHETAKDTTEGGKKPLGQRGAAMADRVAA